MLRRLYPQLTTPQAITESHTPGAIRGIVLSVLNCTIRDETKNKTVDVTAAASIAGTELAAYEIVAIEDVSELFPPVKGKIGFDKENVVICHVK